MSKTAPSTRPEPLFLTTRWSVVLAARDAASPESAAALEALCRTYWYPVYGCIRRRGHRPADAQDLAQAFFARLLANNDLRKADRQKGRFRTFLSVVLKRFLANEWDRAHRLKRGGWREIVPLDTALAERRYQAEPSAGLLSPDRAFERRWAMTLLDRTMDRLRAEYANAGKGAEYDRLKDSLTADRGTIPYAELAAALHLSEGAVRVAVHRLRKRFRELFRAAVADTVSDPRDVEDELRHMVNVLSRG
ncbi:MAG: sigma-70 family RNA polymerase sigma factor [Verrucomicrobia bacterium]|nr:sigma-70 family RNA polymerase sigma factor [Verrucomicrobiota bacterium]